MDSFLSVMMILLFSTFMTAGVIKVLQPKEKLVGNIPWVEEFSSAHLKLLGTLEVSGALGLVLPKITGVPTILTSLSATCMVFVMAGASALHLRRQEHVEAGITLVLLVMAAVVAWGSLGLYSA